MMPCLPTPLPGKVTFVPETLLNVTSSVTLTGATHPSLSSASLVVISTLLFPDNLEETKYVSVVVRVPYHTIRSSSEGSTVRLG